MQVNTSRAELYQALEHYRTLSAQLRHALDSRVPIEQAKGILAERYRIDLDDAFRLVRSLCRANNLPLSATASAIVDQLREPRQRR